MTETTINRRMLTNFKEIEIGDKFYPAWSDENNTPAPVLMRIPESKKYGYDVEQESGSFNAVNMKTGEQVHAGGLITWIPECSVTVGVSK